MSCTDTRRKRFAKWRIDCLIHDAVDIARKRACDYPFQQLLDVVLSQSDLLRPRPVSGYAAWTHTLPLLRGLLAIAGHRKSWLRDLSQWSSPAGSCLAEFGFLVRHLLATHPVPNFMTLVWLAETSAAVTRHQKLFKHLGAGNSIHGCDLPIRLTKSMAQFFMLAPDHFTVPQALRWSQVRGMGGDVLFAAAVLSTRLGTTFEHERHWEGVLNSLINRPKLDIAFVPPIIEFIHAHCTGFARQPIHKLSDRKFDSFLSRVRTWMHRNPNYCRHLKLSWRGTSIGGFRYSEQQKHPWSWQYWTVRELTDNRQLVDEGRDLHHCVASYAQACAKRKTSIWSLQCHGSLQSNRVLTIEVAPDQRRIVTALGRYNSSPKAEARRVMEMWAEQEGLTIARWV